MFALADAVRAYVESVTAHIAEGSTAVYARSRYQREHHEALQALADEIDRLATVDEKVVRLAGRSA
jgi:hypothetical protein